MFLANPCPQRPRQRNVMRRWAARHGFRGGSRNSDGTRPTSCLCGRYDCALYFGARTSGHSQRRPPSHVPPAQRCATVRAGTKQLVVRTLILTGAGCLFHKGSSKRAARSGGARELRAGAARAFNKGNSNCRATGRATGRGRGRGRGRATARSRKRSRNRSWKRSRNRQVAEEVAEDEVAQQPGRRGSRGRGRGDSRQ